jgi:hypothetical protein
MQRLCDWEVYRWRVLVAKRGLPTELVQVCRNELSWTDRLYCINVFVDDRSMEKAFKGLGVVIIPVSLCEEGERTPENKASGDASLHHSFLRPRDYPDAALPVPRSCRPNPSRTRYRTRGITHLCLVRGPRNFDAT